MNQNKPQDPSEAPRQSSLELQAMTAIQEVSFQNNPGNRISITEGAPHVNDTQINKSDISLLKDRNDDL
jgi:hypothetical protein